MAQCLAVRGIAVLTVQFTLVQHLISTDSHCNNNLNQTSIVLGASEISANLYCNSRTSVLGKLRDYLRLLMGRTLPLCPEYCLRLKSSTSIQNPTIYHRGLGKGLYSCNVLYSVYCILNELNHVPKLK